MKIIGRKFLRFFGIGPKIHYDPWSEREAALALKDRGYRVVEVRMTQRAFEELRGGLDKINATRADVGLLQPLFSARQIEFFESRVVRQ